MREIRREQARRGSLRKRCQRCQRSESLGDLSGRDARDARDPSLSGKKEKGGTPKEEKQTERLQTLKPT